MTMIETTTEVLTVTFPNETVFTDWTSRNHEMPSDFLRVRRVVQLWPHVGGVGLALHQLDRLLPKRVYLPAPGRPDWYPITYEIVRIGPVNSWAVTFSIMASTAGAGTFVLKALNVFRDWEAERRIRLAKAVEKEARAALVKDVCASLGDALFDGHIPPDVVARNVLRWEYLAALDDDGAAVEGAPQQAVDFARADVEDTLGAITQLPLPVMKFELSED